jgi:glycosyltransferase involved in cell wall biosynthesis
VPQPDRTNGLSPAADKRASGRDEAIRILHCIPTFGGGGAERQLSYLADALARRGVDVHIAYTGRGPNFDRLLGSNVKLHELSCSGNYDPRSLYKLMRVIERVKPDLVQAWLRQMIILGGIAATITRVPFIICERSCSPAYSDTWKDWLSIRIGKRAAAIVANSDGGGAFWKTLTEAPLHVIRNGIPFAEIEKAPAISDDKAQLPHGAELVLFAGRFDPPKNIERTVEALRQVLSRRESAFVIMFGEGSLRNNIADRVASYRLGNRLRLLGYGTDLWGWMKRANVFVSASLYEGHPNTVLEAAVCHSPLVLSGIASHREFLDDDSAYFVPVSDSSKIADGVLRALAEPEEAKQRAGIAWKRVTAYSIESTLKQYLAVYALTLRRAVFDLGETL